MQFIACSSFRQQSMKASADTVADALVEVDAFSLNEVQRYEAAS